MEQESLGFLSINHVDVRNNTNCLNKAFSLAAFLLFTMFFSCNNKLVSKKPDTKSQEEKLPSSVTEVEVYTIVKEPATPVEGGYSTFNKYISDSMQYPESARKKKIEGRVLIEFIVDKDGSLTEVKVVKGIGGGCDEEAIRIIEEAEKWKPGRNKGVEVKQRILYPIDFKL